MIPTGRVGLWGNRSGHDGCGAEPFDRAIGFSGGGVIRAGEESAGEF